jgi:hypothetical protein
VTFQLQPYVGNNVVLDSGALTLTTPASYTSLAFLTSAQGATGQSFDATLGFSDGTTTLLTGSDPDWVTPPPSNTAIGDVGVIRPNNSWTGFYAGALDMFEHDYTLSASDQAKVLDSIGFSRTSGNHEMLFAVSGYSAVPEPSSMAMLVGMGITGACFLGRHRRR